MSHAKRSSEPIRVLLAAVLAVALLGCGSDTGDDPVGADATVGGAVLQVTQASLDLPPNPSVAAIRMVIDNPTDRADALVGVSSADGAAAIHRSEIDDEGRSTMTPMDRIPVPAGSQVAFRPGALHVMLTGIERRLEVGDTVELVLELEEAGELEVEVPVVEPGGEDGDHGDHADHEALGASMTVHPLPPPTPIGTTR